MHPLQEHIESICGSGRFQASPKLASLLRFLAADALAAATEPPSQRMIAAAVLQLPDPDSPSAGAAVRVQMGRLRKLLDRYYEEEGIADPIRAELPLRDYRLRFLRDGQPITVGQVRTTDTPILAVADTRSLVPEPMPPGLADSFSRNLLAELGGHSAVTTVGPIAPPRLPDGTPRHVDPRLHGPATFVLDTAVQAAGDNVRVLAMLFSGLPPRQIWTQTYAFAAAPGEAGRSMARTARKLAADVADECGAIVREILRGSAGKAAADHTVVEAMMSLWRYWITGSQDDLAFARQALDHAVANAAESPLALGFWVAVACQEYTSSLDPRARLPAIVLERAELARRHAIGTPWIELVRGYALWLTRQTAGLSAILDQLETVQASATFRGLLGAMRIAANIDAERGRSVLADAIADSPHPLLWFHVCAAIHDLECGDFDSADRALAAIDAPSRPEPIVLRACAAAARGDLDAARGILDAVVEALPEFPVVGEVILRRWLDDRHVDAIAALLRPVGIDWFHAPTIGIVRG
jgi:hypothetical protein